VRLTERIGFGCGRLRSGLEERNSRRLIESALESGIRYFDTAPSYGDGASERVLGLCLRDVRREVAVCSKIGFARQRGSAAIAAARAVLRAAAKPIYRRLISGGSARRAHASAGGPAAGEAAAAREYGRFEPSRLRADLQESLEALQTDYLDCLMLHEPRQTDPEPDLAQALRALVTEGVALRIGVGTGSAIESLPRYGDVAQAALSPALLNAEGPRALIAHGVFRALNAQEVERCANESGLLRVIPSLRAHLSNEAGSSGLLLNCLALGTRLERVLWSTSSVARLRSVLAAAEAIHGEIRGAWSAEREAMLADAARRYAYGVQAAR
jgi:hypothetical protein